MKKFYKTLKISSIAFGLVAIAIIMNSNEHQPEPNKLKSKKSSKKSLVVNGHKYDGPEKFAYYQSAIRAGQEDLNTPMKYPQYSPFSRRKALTNAKNQIRSKGSISKTSATATFIERGPANVPGRTRSIIIDPDDASGETWFAANVSGGIWKTINSGGTWVEIAPDLENMAIVTLAMAESNTSVIYAGTGEGSTYNATIMLNGDGIYKSVDKGVTWSLLPNTTTDDFINVSRIIVDPTNPDILVASTSGHKIIGSGAVPVGAIMRSTDGGTSWNKVHTTTAPVQQIIAAPSNFDIQYASVAAGLGVMKSIDSGLTWNDASTGLSLSGRMEIGISSSNPDKLYGSALGSLSGTDSDLYLTEDGGDNWGLVSVEYAGAAIDFLGGQGWYDNTILVNPFDDDNVYFGGVGIFSVVLNSSKDGSNTYGADLTVIADAYSDYNGANSFSFNQDGTINGIHPDQHFMTTVITDEPNSEFKIVLGNDGGIYVSDVGTAPGIGEGSWTWAGADYNTTQFYGADKIAGQEKYLGGAQDNGTWVSADAEVADATSVYGFAIGGDGFEVVAHYTNPNKYIGGSQNNGFRGFEDGSAYSATSGIDRDNSPFVSRLSSSYQDPDLLFAVGAGGVYRSTDFGRNWKESSIATGWGFWSGSDVEVSKADPSIVWAGGRMTSNDSLFVSQDGGFSFDAVPNFDNIGLCTGLYSHPTDRNVAFAVFSVADSPKILKTEDLGQNWVDISGYSVSSTSTGFPDVATFAVQVMPYDNDVIWAGTEIGLFESLDAGLTWNLVDNFPSVTIWDFKIKDGQVIIATHGRGIWSADIPALAGFTAPDVTLAPVVTSIGASLVELQVDLTIDLRSVYENSEVLVDDVVVVDIAGNTAGAIEDITIDFETADTYSIKVVSYKDGISYYSETFEIVVADPVTALTAYFADFDNTGAGDFTLDNWTIDTPTGFTNDLLSTPHPYSNDINWSASLNMPIEVAATDAILSFQEIVQVEEGTAGTVFGDDEFWDYVIVEGSTDGLNWTPLLDGYDARDNNLWDGSSNTADNSLFAERTVDLLDTYTAGEVILLRFRLFADAGANAWGWAIDDLKIQIADEDGDGFNSIDDCDDTDASINPDAIDIAFNGIDENCDGADSLDGDGDGYDLSDDCDDTNAEIFPGATEIANNDVDEDCDGEDLVVAGTNDSELDTRISVYPNPSSGEVNIDFDNVLSGEVKLQVLDFSGRVVMTKSIDNTTANSKLKVDLSAQSFGLYSIILTDQSNTSIVKRVLIY